MAFEVLSGTYTCPRTTESVELEERLLVQSLDDLPKILIAHQKLMSIKSSCVRLYGKKCIDGCPVGRALDILVKADYEVQRD